MFNWKEKRRVADIQLDTWTYDTNCEVCGKPITLWYNGGELDYAECCDRRYELDAPQLDFVVRERHPTSEETDR
jgi:hypothetical protein